MIEIWKYIKGTEDHYQVSNQGRIRSVDRIIFKLNRWGFYGELSLKGRILKTPLNKYGYPHISCIRRNDKCKTTTLHRLIAEMFIVNSDNKPEINHIDGNKSNNCIENLEWTTHLENQNHARKMGLIDQKGGKHVSAKAVIQRDYNGNIIKRYESMMDAQRELGIKQQVISNVCRGLQKTAGGYLWAYA